ncbi:Cyclic nucleotide-binding domain-containing protein [uncultured Gammaproteobacteria bacterium]
MTIPAIPRASVESSLRRTLYHTLHPGSRSVSARVVRGLVMAMVVIGVSGIIIASDSTAGNRDGALVAIVLAGFTLEYLLRQWVAPEQNLIETEAWDLEATGEAPPQVSSRRARWRWARSPLGIIDLLAVIPIPIAWGCGVDLALAELLGVLWVFKLARYSPGLTVLGRVIQIEREPLLSVLYAFFVVLLCAAVLIHLVEGPVQPEFFGTVPKALWWAVVTLTTTGYGDEVPVTALGRLIGGVVMMGGVAVVGLWAGLLATGFSQEMRRREFLKTWDLVSKVPFFRNVGAGTIAAVARCLRPREVAAGAVITRRGDPGDCMYFIVSGRVEVRIVPAPLILTDGDFFGEIALLTGGRRTATAAAVADCLLLLLDIADFRELVASHPALGQAIEAEGQRRMQRWSGRVESRDDKA